MAGAIRSSRFLLALVLLALGAILFAVSVADESPRGAGAASSGPEIGLSLASGGVCQPNPNECTVLPSQAFVISIDAVTIPAGGYILAQGWIDYGDDLGDQGANGAIKNDSLEWPDCHAPSYVTTNTNESGISNLDSYGAGCLTGFSLPMPVSTYTGSLYTVELTCPTTPSDHVIELLLDGEPPAYGSGAVFIDSTGEPVVPKVNDLTIHCSFVTDTVIPDTPANEPDLLVWDMKVELETGSNCNFPSTNLGVSITVRNHAGTTAGPFTVEVNGDQQAVPAGLAAASQTTLWFKGYEQFQNNVGIVDVLDEVDEYNEFNNTLSTFLAIPTLPPTCTPPPTSTPKPPDGDTDGDLIPNSSDPDDDNDGCTDVQELGPDPEMGGTRDPHDRWDYYDVIGFSGAPPDQVIDLPNDILGVILHYAPSGYTPGTPALIGSGVFDDFDRGVKDPVDGWPTAPDGVIDLANDILGVILQYQHNCA